MDNYYETKPGIDKTIDNPLEENIPKNPRPLKTKTFFDLKTILIAIVVFVLVAGASTGLFYYLKNKKAINAVTSSAETIADLLPTPEGTATAAESKQEEKNNSSENSSSSTVQTAIDESKIQSQEASNTETVRKHESLAITTIAPDSGAPIAGNNPFYIALTSNNPAIAYYESVEYIHKNGSVTTILGVPQNNPYSQSIIIAVPNQSNISSIKVKLVIKDIYNQTVTKHLTYLAL